MTTGVSVVNLANAWLNTMRGNGAGVTFTAPAALYVQCHFGDPGAVGTANVSTAITTRTALAMNAAASGSQTITTAINFTATNSETITHISVWSASSAGTFYYSAPLTTPRTVINGDTLSLVTLTVQLIPVAA